MFIDLDNRGTGKTTTLIHDAYFTGLPIVVPSMQRKEYVLGQAKNMGVDVTVYTVSELRDGKTSLRNCDVLVDELEDVLNTALGGVNVVKANMSRKGRV